MELPFDILLHIALTSPAAWKSMVAIPAIGMWGREHADAVARRFIREVDLGFATIWLLPNGTAHSIYDKPGYIHKNGSSRWYKYGKLHRDGGPAVVEQNEILWCRDGKIHREDGPALVSRTQRAAWFINGERTDTASRMTDAELREVSKRYWQDHIDAI